MRREMVDRWVGIAFMAVAAVWCWLVLNTISAAGMEGAPGPRAFPLLVGEILGVLGLIMTAFSWVSPEPGAKSPRFDPVRSDEVAIVGSGLVLCLAYAFLMDKLGFLVATPIVVGLALRVVLGLRGWLRIALVAAGLTLGCYVVFAMLMQANLPQGDWFAVVED